MVVVLGYSASGNWPGSFAACCAAAAAPAAELDEQHALAALLAFAYPDRVAASAARAAVAIGWPTAARRSSASRTRL